MGDLNVRLLLRLLRDEPNPDPMAERLMEMYRDWWRRAGSRFPKSPKLADQVCQKRG